MAGPITPNEVAKTKKNLIPETVFEVFNELIAQNFYAGHAVVKQKDVVSLLVAKGLKKEEIFKKHWLDVEPVYRQAGWTVVYDSPAYCEDYEAYFEFSSK